MNQALAFRSSFRDVSNGARVYRPISLKRTSVRPANNAGPPENAFALSGCLVSPHIRSRGPAVTFPQCTQDGTQAAPFPSQAFEAVLCLPDTYVLYAGSKTFLAPDVVGSQDARLNSKS